VYNIYIYVKPHAVVISQGVMRGCDKLLGLSAWKGRDVITGSPDMCPSEDGIISIITVYYWDAFRLEGV
jgi:hypothetical protein